MTEDEMVGRPSNRLGRQPWALSLPDKELCLREALAVCTPPAPEPSACLYLTWSLMSTGLASGKKTDDSRNSEGHRNATHASYLSLNS